MEASMKSKKMFQVCAMAVVLLFLRVAGVMGQTPSTPISSRGIVPLFYHVDPGEKMTCDQVGDYEIGSLRFDDSDQYAGIAGPMTWSTTDSQYVAWDGRHSGLAIILKSESGANVYKYDPSYTYDSGLASPPNPDNIISELSNIIFCWNPPERECEWINEIAWAAGNRYVTRDNWSTYTPYVAGNTVTLYAGESIEAGTVHFSAPVDCYVTITIELNDGWRFEDVEENFKIQDYPTAPSGNPAPGLFAYKGYATEDSFSVVVPVADYYGVHLNVEWERCE
jgi:hypothetical protein